MESMSVWLKRLESHPLPVIDMQLERVDAFLRSIGHPQHHLPPVVHVAGTNGKGSTIATLHSLMKAHGYKAHRYTSPHLVRFNERFVVADHEASDAMLVEGLESMKSALDTCPLTYFESTTMLALLLFSQHAADYTLLEVGMGGRLDATNVVTQPACTVITPISMDHQAFLGNTLAEIAGEKAAIIKPNTPCIVGRQDRVAMTVIEQVAEERGAPLYRMGKEWNYSTCQDGRLDYHSDTLSVTTPASSLAGQHQYDNAATALACADILGLHDTPLLSHGIAHTQWNGRLQPLDSQIWNTHHQIIVDGGHNIAAAHSLQYWMKQQSLPVHLLLGIRQDKDYTLISEMLAQNAHSIHTVTIPNDPYACEAALLKATLNQLGYEAEAHSHIERAITHITHTYTKCGIIFIAGSLYLAGAILGIHDSDN